MNIEAKKRSKKGTFTWKKNDEHEREKKEVEYYENYITKEDVNIVKSDIC